MIEAFDRSLITFSGVSGTYKVKLTLADAPLHVHPSMIGMVDPLTYQPCTNSLKLVGSVD